MSSQLQSVLFSPFSLIPMLYSSRYKNIAGEKLEFDSKVLLVQAGPFLHSLVAWLLTNPLSQIDLLT